MPGALLKQLAVQIETPMPRRPGSFGRPIFIYKQMAGQFVKGYYTCPVAGHDIKAGLKGETSYELTTGGGFEFNRAPLIKHNQWKFKCMIFLVCKALKKSSNLLIPSNYSKQKNTSSTMLILIISLYYIQTKMIERKKKQMHRR